MMFLILEETTFKGSDSIYIVVNHTNNEDKANDMLQGYNLVNKKNNVFYSILKYETQRERYEESTTKDKR